MEVVTTMLAFFRSDAPATSRAILPARFASKTATRRRPSKTSSEWG